MKLLNKMTVKSLADTVVGELISIRAAGEPSLAIVIRKSETKPSTRIGFLDLRLNSGVETIWTDYQGGDPSVISYGTDWALELAPDKDTWAENHNMTGAPLVIQLTKDGPILRFGPPNSGGGAEKFNLSANQCGNDLIDPAPVRAWRIWASSTDAANPRAKPLFEAPLV